MLTNNRIHHQKPRRTEFGCSSTGLRRDAELSGALGSDPLAAHQARNAVLPTLDAEGSQLLPDAGTPIPFLYCVVNKPNLLGQHAIILHAIA